MEYDYYKNANSIPRPTEAQLIRDEIEALERRVAWLEDCASYFCWMFAGVGVALILVVILFLNSK